MVAFVLVHSPLVGPLTWQPVADVLGQRGFTVAVPSLVNTPGQGIPYWRQHVEAVAQSIASLPKQESFVVVGHSGGGMLLPAIGATLERSVAGYIFVDADIPRNGRSRLDLFAPEAAEGVRKRAAGGFLPVWTEDDLRQVIPDPVLRRRFVAELRPMPLAVYEEPIPLAEGWPDTPCGYLSFSGTGVYGEAIEEAQRRGWAYAEMDGLHFHMLVEPVAVADALLGLAGRMDINVTSRMEG